MPPRRRLPPQQRFNTGTELSHCKWCRSPVRWLRSPSTDRLAPIDAWPAPDGNIRVEGDTYVVVPPAELALFHGPAADRPSLHLNHWVTCTNATARRLAKARQKGHDGPLVADGVPVHPADRNGSTDMLAPPLAVAARNARCDVCRGPLDPALFAAGIQVHPCC